MNNSGQIVLQIILLSALCLILLGSLSAPVWELRRLIHLEAESRAENTFSEELLLESLSKLKENSSLELLKISDSEAQFAAKRSFLLSTLRARKKPDWAWLIRHSRPACAEYLRAHSEAPKLCVSLSMEPGINLIPASVELEQLELENAVLLVLGELKLEQLKLGPNAEIIALGEIKISHLSGKAKGSALLHSATAGVAISNSDSGINFCNSGTTAKQGSSNQIDLELSGFLKASLPQSPNFSAPPSCNFPRETGGPWKQRKLLYRQ